MLDTLGTTHHWRRVARPTFFPVYGKDWSLRWHGVNQWRAMFTLRGEGEPWTMTYRNGVTIAQVEAFHHRDREGWSCATRLTVVLLGFGVTAWALWNQYQYSEEVVTLPPSEAV